jgi:hypothetical protein
MVTVIGWFKIVLTIMVTFHLGRWAYQVWMDTVDEKETLEKTNAQNKKFCDEICSIQNAHEIYGDNIAACRTKCGSRNYIWGRAFILATRNFYICGTDTPCVDVFFKFIGSITGAVFLFSLAIVAWHNRWWLLYFVSIGFIKQPRATRYEITEDQYIATRPAIASM